MIRFCCRCCLWLVLGLGPGFGGLTDAQADLRVLISFDASGHRLQKVIRLPVERTGRQLGSTRSHDRPVRNLAVQSRQAVANWFDSHGRLLDSQLITDPRVIHAPPSLPVDGSPRQALQSTGTYLLTGPSEAAMVSIVLPVATAASPSFGLRTQPASAWQFTLTP